MNEYQEKLKSKMDNLLTGVYSVSKSFPKEERYCLTSQLRRATLSVVLNYIEGYARRRILVRLNFLEIAFGSLKESQYILKFANLEGYILEVDYLRLQQQSDEIGAMLWREIDNIDRSTG